MSCIIYIYNDIIDGIFELSLCKQNDQFQESFKFVLAYLLAYLLFRRFYHRFNH